MARLAACVERLLFPSPTAAPRLLVVLRVTLLLPLPPPVLPAACAAAPAASLTLVPFCWSMMAAIFCICCAICWSCWYSVPFSLTRWRTFSMPSKSIMSSAARAASALAGAKKPIW